LVGWDSLERRNLVQEGAHTGIGEEAQQKLGGHHIDDLKRLVAKVVLINETIKVLDVRVVTEVAAPMVEVVVTAPVFASIEIVWKPFCERTGPLNVVLAI
jgi:hypothetical protein